MSENEGTFLTIQRANEEVAGKLRQKWYIHTHIYIYIYIYISK